MKQMIPIMGIMDSLRGKDSAIENYENKLYQYREQEAEILIDIGLLYLDAEQIEEALNNFHDALNTYQKMDYAEGKAFTHDLIGDTYITDRNTKNALKHYKKAYDIYSAIGSSMEDEMSEKIEEVTKIQEAIAISSENEQDREYMETATEKGSEDIPKKRESIPEPALSSKKSIPATMDKIADKLETAILLLNNSSLYEEYYKDANGMEYLEEALHTADVIEDWEGKGTIHLMLGDSLLKLKDVDKAFDHFKKAYKLFESNDSKLGQAVSLLLLGTIYFIQNKEQDMYEFFKEAMELFQELNYKKGEKTVISIVEMLSK